MVHEGGPGGSDRKDEHEVFVRVLGKAGRVTLMDGNDVVRVKDRSNRRREVGG